MALNFKIKPAHSGSLVRAFADACKSMAEYKAQTEGEACSPYV